jgi:hypothetical protein
MRYMLALSVPLLLASHALAQFLPYRVQVERRLQNLERQQQQRGTDPTTQAILESIRNQNALLQQMLAKPPQVLIVERDPRQVLPVDPKPKQDLPVELKPKQELPIEPKPREEIPVIPLPPQVLPIGPNPQTLPAYEPRLYRVR